MITKALAAILVVSLTWGSASARAKPPTLTTLFPAGARQGTTTLVTASGSFDGWPVRGWAEGRGLTIEAAGEKGKFWVTVDDDAPVGSHRVRLYNDEGASALRPFLVGSLPETPDVEPNDDPKRPQPLDRDAVTVNGRLGRVGDVDIFARRLTRGETIVAALEANRRLGSPMDGVLQVTDPRGFVLAHNDDDQGRDPRLAFEAPADGVYLVRLFAFPATPDSRIGLAGGDPFIYRLTLTTRGFLDHAFPLAVPRGATTTVRAGGWNIPETSRRLAVRPNGAEVVRVSDPALANDVEVRADPHDTALESEPAPPAGPQALTPPVTLSGRIDPEGDSDVFRFPARKGVKLSLRVESRSIGFPLDPTLRLTDAAGKVIAEEDDSGGRDSRDAEIGFSPPGDGEYLLTVRDLNGGGGPRSLYRLTIAPDAPEVRLTLPADRFTLTPGTPQVLKVAVERRHGFAEPLRVEAVDLPEGVTAKPAVSEPRGETSGSVALTLQAHEGRHSGAFRVVARAAHGDSPALARVDGFPATIDGAWLTVLPRK